MKLNSLICMAVVFFTACEKEAVKTDITPKEEGVQITFKSITENSQVPFGADTSVQVYLWDELSLHEYTVEIVDDSAKSWFYEEGHSHKAEILLSWPWKNIAPAGTKLTLAVKASNHAGIVTNKKITFISAP